MKANRAFELLVTRGDPRPSFLADPERTDRIEVVSIDDGETVLFWEAPAREAAGLIRSLRRDLAGLDREAFLRAWDGADANE
ncbi:MAG TPA: hypothetical protein VLP43_01855 [Solirubrobacteraceae bacterium]|nr:hypothetical protein [Solirubrobacteraceae bacterium]